MSTTIKPLELYVEGVKVYPDSDILKYAGTNLMSVIDAKTNEVQNNHSSWMSVMYDSQNNDPFILPPMVDNDENDFHMNDNGDIHQMSNYWNFYHAQIYDIQFDLNLRWTAVFDWECGAFNTTKLKTINFTGTLPKLEGWYYDENEQQHVVYRTTWCRAMFGWNTNLEEIHGLQFDETTNFVYDTSYLSGDYVDLDFVAGWGFHSNPAELCAPWRNMFSYDINLRVLDVDWPTYFVGDSFESMFEECNSLPDNQIPTLNLVSMTSGHTIWCYKMFAGCTHCASTHLSATSWLFIEFAGDMYAGTQLHSIDIPADANHLTNIHNILGDIPTDLSDPTEYANYKYIIRTEAPFNAYADAGYPQSDYDNLLLFNNAGDINGRTDILQYFGGIYVPDSQVSGWKSYYQERDLNNIADCIHGLSDL